jgi:hypothetical protein
MLVLRKEIPCTKPVENGSKAEVKVEEEPTKISLTKIEFWSIRAAGTGNNGETM